MKQPTPILAFWTAQPQPKPTKHTFMYRVAQGATWEVAILPHPLVSNSNYTFWKQTPAPKASKEVFYKNLADGMTLEGSVMTHMQRKQVWMGRSATLPIPKDNATIFIDNELVAKATAWHASKEAEGEILPPLQNFLSGLMPYSDFIRDHVYDEGLMPYRDFIHDHIYDEGLTRLEASIKTHRQHVLESKDSD